MKAINPGQFAFLNWDTFRGNCLLGFGLTSTFAITTLWSAMPGETVTSFTRVGLEVRKMSRTFSLRVGSVTICTRLESLTRDTKSS